MSTKKTTGTKKFTLQIPADSLADLSPKETRNNDDNDYDELKIPTNTKNVSSNKKETLASIRKHQSDKKQEKHRQEEEEEEEDAEDIEKQEARAKERKALVDGLTAKNQHIAFELENSKMKLTLKENNIRALEDENYSLRSYIVKLENNIDAYQYQYESVMKENQHLRAQLKDSVKVDSKATHLFHELHLYLFGKDFNENNNNVSANMSSNQETSVNNDNHSTMSLNEENSSRRETSTRESQQIEIYQSYHASESRMLDKDVIESEPEEEEEIEDEDEDEDEESEDELEEEEEVEKQEDVVHEVVQQNEEGLCTILETTEFEMTSMTSMSQSHSKLIVDDTQLLDDTVNDSQQQQQQQQQHQRKSVTFNDGLQMMDQRPPTGIPKTIFKRKSITNDNNELEPSRKSINRRKSSFGGCGGGVGGGRRKSKMYSVGGSYQGPLLNEDIIYDAEKASLLDLACPNEEPKIDESNSSIFTCEDSIPEEIQINDEPIEIITESIVSINSNKPNTIFKSKKKKECDENINPIVNNNNKLEEMSDYLSGCLSQDEPKETKIKTPKRVPRKSASKAKKKLEDQEIEDQLLQLKIAKSNRAKKDEKLVNSKPPIPINELAASKPPIPKKKSILKNKQVNTTPAIIDPLPITRRKSLNESSRMSIETIYEGRALDTTIVQRQQDVIKLEAISDDEVNNNNYINKRNFNHVDEPVSNEHISIKKIKLESSSSSSSSNVDKENCESPIKLKEPRRSRSKTVNYKEQTINTKMRRDGDVILVKSKVEKS